MSSFINNSKHFLKNFFTYEEHTEYNFTLSETQSEMFEEHSNAASNEEEMAKEPKKIFPTLALNLEAINIKYNTLINSDIVIRQFTLTARNKQYQAFILYIDGMVNTDLINNNILNPIMLRNIANTYTGEESRVVSEAISNNITIRKVKRFDLADYLYNELMPQNSVKKQTEFSEIISGVNSR